MIGCMFVFRERIERLMNTPDGMDAQLDDEQRGEQRNGIFLKDRRVERERREQRWRTRFTVYTEI